MYFTYYHSLKTFIVLCTSETFYLKIKCTSASDFLCKPGKCVMTVFKIKVGHFGNCSVEIFASSTKIILAMDIGCSQNVTIHDIV
jgi:hypothetical protein